MLRILHLEDCDKDAFLIEQAVKDGGVQAEFKMVKNRQEFISALEVGQFDLILADSSVLDLDNISALKAAREKYPGIEFICLSGHGNPAHIKASFDAGVNDYISKNDLPYLITTLQREAERCENEA
jgi:CheY-like chemotaxis protein